MKITGDFNGVFERYTSDGNEIPATSLSTLLEHICQMADDQHRHHLSAIHQASGLSFLPATTFRHLFTQIPGRSPLLTQTMLRPYPQHQERANLQWRYRFVTQNFTLELADDDPQIPQWVGDRCKGNYRSDIDQVPAAIKEQIYSAMAAEVQQQIETQPVEILHKILRSPDPDHLVLSTTRFPCQAWLSLSELSLEIQEATAMLRGEIQSASELACQLVVSYRQIHSGANASLRDEVPHWVVSSQMNAQLGLMVGRSQHRAMLTKFIELAKEFLVLSSFRIEDEPIVHLIAQKARELPGGVWILTDLGNDVQDRLDPDMADRLANPEEYANSDQKKKNCLKLLATAGVRIRSGPFHLKTWISEHHAYLGSCNLTGGSLERNYEAGILWQNTPEHRFLVEYVHHLWQHCAEARILPSLSGIRSIGLTPTRLPCIQDEHFLHHYAYKRDLLQSLQEFAHAPDGEIRIYSRNFLPTPDQESLLRSLRCRIFYAQFNNSNLPARKIPHLHAKIVLVGNRVAYIGSQDCAFGRNPVHELTYKITDPKVINNLKQKIQTLHS